MRRWLTAARYGLEQVLGRENLLVHSRANKIETGVDMSGKRRICILGGTGFVGRHLITRLAGEGHYVKVLTRRRERHHSD